MESVTNKSQHSLKIYENSFQSKSEAKIIDIVKQQVKIMEHGKPILIDAVGLVLNKTIFHPQGGGQPSDKGTINGISVLIAKEDKSQNTKPIYHFLTPHIESHNLEDYFKVGQIVELNIDEQYRKKCSISHTAGHLLADVLELNQNFSIYKAVPTHGHHFPGGEYIKAVIDVPINDKEQFINDLNFYIIESITSNLPIVPHLSNEVRHIKIGESSRMCGGTHLFSTKEIVDCKVNKIKTSKINYGELEKIEVTIYYSC